MALSDEDILRQLISTFKIEADEHLDVLNKRLLELEKAEAAADCTALLEEIFREAHSLKGAARAVEAGAIETTAHSIENLFATAKRGELVLAPAHFDLLYEALDYISAALADLMGDNQSLGDNSDLLSRLSKCTMGEPNIAEPTKTELGSGDMRTADLRVATVKKTLEVEETVRVSTHKLDALMTHIEELLISKIRAEQRSTQLKQLRTSLLDWQKHRDRTPEGTAGTEEFLDRLIRDFSKDSLRMSLVVEDLQDDIRRVRMLPVASLFESSRRLVRDLSRAEGKQVDLIISGSDTELDRQLIEGIRDPLTHLLRNAVDHGLECPAVRKAANKPVTGTIRLRAGQQGNMILIEIEDDGVGLDVDKIKARAVKEGVLAPDEAQVIPDEDARLLIFRSGFSTAPEVTDISGRGVGLDVVKTNIEKLHGLVAVGAGASGGAKFSLSLPLTLSTSRVLLIQAAGETYAIPTSAIERIVRVDQSDIFTIADREVIQAGGRSMPLVCLRDVLELPQVRRADHIGKIPTVILGAAEKRVAFAVDSLLGETEVVIKPLGKILSRVRNVSGATILGDGKVAMILNISDLIKSAKNVARPVLWPEESKSVTQPQSHKEVSVLVVDDSITTRVMEKNILESAGYHVALANDGFEAFEILQRGHFDLIVSDVDMPQMNGFELTAKVKETASLKDLPVVLVTALDSTADKELGLECGADAYIVKHAFDQKNLLEAIEQLV
jgi:two-component system chemotaxis sensor kinase CheA